MKQLKNKALGTFLVAAAFLLGGCSAMDAQNPNAGYKPVNAVPDTETGRLMLKGYDVVSYFVDGKHRMGSAQNRSTYKEVTFYFASEEHKTLFDKAPEKYLPEFGGYCANGMAYGIPWGGDGDTWKMIDGKLYIFGGQSSKDAFLLEEKGNLALAQRYWDEEVKGSNSFWQRSKRLVFKVPHYKSGDELAKAVSEAKAQGKL